MHQTLAVLQTLSESHGTFNVAAPTGGEPTILAEGLLELTKRKAGDVTTTARVVTVAAAVVGILIEAVRSGFAISKIVMAVLVAGFVIWSVFNITSVKDRVGDELARPLVHSAPSQPPAERSVLPGPAAGLAGL